MNEEEEGGTGDGRNAPLLGCVESCFTRYLLPQRVCCCSPISLNVQLVALDILKGSLVFVAFLLFLLLSTIDNFQNPSLRFFLVYSFASIVFACFELLYVFPVFEKPRLFRRLKYYALLKLLFSAALLIVPFLWYRKLVTAAKAEDDRDLQIAFTPLLLFDLLCAYFGYCHFLLAKS